MIATWKLKDGQIQFENGAPVLLKGLDAIRQRLEVRIKKWKGEYFVDLNSGIDWQDLLDGDVDVETIKLFIRAELLADEYVDAVNNLEATLNRTDRTINITFETRGNLGTVTGEV